MATVLIVDSRSSERQIYITLLGSFGHRLLEANDGREALDLARKELPDLVITDVVMPNMDGFSLAQSLRKEPLLATVPIVFQTAPYLESEVRKLALSSGIKYILTKPAEPQEILRVVHEALKQPSSTPAKLAQTGQLRREHLQLLADKLYEKNMELERANERLRNLSLTDDLTGLNNRRGFMIMANGLLKFARRAGHPLCLLYIDMDCLKQVNDTFGHTEGDLALTHFAHILTETFRDSDVIARMGGDEFAILTIDATENNISAIRARLQSNLDAHNLVSVRGYALSFSIGVIRVDLDTVFTVEGLLNQADAAMYQHKQQRKRSS